MDALVPGQAPSGSQTSQTSQLAEGNLLKGNQASPLCTAAGSHRHGSRPISRQSFLVDVAMLVAGDVAATVGVLKVACSTQVRQPRLRTSRAASQPEHRRSRGGAREQVRACAAGAHLAHHRHSRQACTS